MLTIPNLQKADWKLHVLLCCHPESEGLVDVLSLHNCVHQLIHKF